ncbi:MAG: glycosyltransferase [Hyphomicrobiales bacterium]|nr:glycosyltransferase [Hyphomicrobiales bacterium]
MTARLDIVVPVYNEGRNILATLGALRDHMRTPARILICYDRPDDDTLTTIKANPARVEGLQIEFVRNPGRGAHGAIMAGFSASRAPFVMVYPADDDFNGAIVDAMVGKAEAGADIVCASRFIPGGCMVGCPWLKALLVRTAAFTLYNVARRIAVESDSGFCYSIELLVKCHRLGWPVAEVPAQWFERTKGASRFRVISWLPAYLRWFGYAFATTYLRRPAGSVKLRSPSNLAT